MNAYLFVHFTGTESESHHEQIYFSVSKNGNDWQILNRGKAVLENHYDEGGARDPYIVRSPHGDKFYIIATNLSISNRRQTTDEKTAWERCRNILPNNPTPGSKKMIVWESDNLIEWKERLVDTAVSDAGCFWAPKCIWDSEKQAYMVFGASCTADDNYSHQKLYRSYTEDFKTFTDPELYMKQDGVSLFDVTIVEHNGMYYRIYKTDRINMDCAKNLDCEWSSIDTNIHSIASFHEGPAICKINGTDSWLLMLDDLASHGGYQAFVTEDLSKGQFSAMTVNFPSDVKYRHGSLLTITNEEYNRLIKKY